MAAPNPAFMPAASKPTLPPKNEQFTVDSLKQFDGSNASLPIYVSVKGTVFDVSSNRGTYGPGGSYNVFAGRDGSKGLGIGSIKPEDAVPDYSALNADQLKKLDQWHGFFAQRYNVAGRLVN